MKTVTVILSSLFLLMTLSMNAQNQGPQHRGPRGQMNPEQMIKKMVEQMKTDLKLNEKQEKQVSELLTANFKQRGEIMKKYQGQRDSIMFYSKKIEEKQNLDMKNILTADQYKTYLTNQEKKKQEWEKRRKEMMEKRKNSGEKGGPATVEEKHDCKGCGGCDDQK